MSIPAVPAVILAGGKARRIGGEDKGLLDVGGRRMVDVIIDRIWPQCHQLFVVGPSDYGRGLATLDDHPDFNGPVAGILGAARALRAQQPRTWLGFLTVPVDGPNLPSDLGRCLTADVGHCVIARDEQGLHPTFAYWAFARLEAALPQLSSNPSLRELAKATGARDELWPGHHSFQNINTPEDLERLAKERRY